MAREPQRISFRDRVRRSWRTEAPRPPIDAGAGYTVVLDPRPVVDALTFLGRAPGNVVREQAPGVADAVASATPGVVEGLGAFPRATGNYVVNRVLPEVVRAQQGGPITSPFDAVQMAGRTISGLMGRGRPAPEPPPVDTTADVLGIGGGRQGGTRATAPTAASGISPDALFNSIVYQESRGRPGLVGPQTRYGRAYGMTQMLDATAEATARQHGVPWRPEMMRGTSRDAANYQRSLGRLHFNDLWRRYNGNPEMVALAYHGGTDQRIWGPRTRRYAREVLGRIGGGSDPFTMPELASLSPSEAMSFAPRPQALERTVLPENVPQREVPAARADLEQADANALLAELRAASQPTPLPKRGPWEGLSAMLAAAASRMSQVDATQGLGALIAAAGGAAGSAAGQYREGLRDEERQQAEAQRQAAIMLARAGFEINRGNLDIRNQNIDRRAQDAERAADVRFGNATNVFQRDMQQAQLDAQTRNANIGALNDWRTRQGQLGFQAASQNVSTQNQMALGQNQLDQQRLEHTTRYESGTQAATRRRDAILAGIGIDSDPAARLQDPSWQNIDSTARLLAAGQHGAVVNNVALAYVTNNDLGANRALIGAMTQAERTAYEQAARDPQNGGAAAAGILAQVMRRRPELAQQVLQQLRTQSNPVVRAIDLVREGGA